MAGGEVRTLSALFFAENFIINTVQLEVQPVEPFLERERMLDWHTRRRLLTVGVMCLSSAGFTRVSR